MKSNEQSSPIFSLLSDIVFKILFSKYPELLMDLLNSCLRFAKIYNIKELTILNPVILPEEVGGKSIALDIQARDNLGRIYDIEMQADDPKIYPNRTLYYLGKILSGQLKKGEHYQKIKTVVGIHFLNYIEYPGYPKYHFLFRLKEDDYPKLLYTEDFTLFLFELPRDKEKKDPDLSHDPYAPAREEWLQFLRNAHNETEKSMRDNYTNPKIHEAHDIFKTLSGDELIRRQVEAREKSWRDEQFFRYRAKEEGKIEGKEEGKIEGKIEGKEEGKIEGKEEGKIEGEKIGKIEGEKIGKIEGEKIGKIEGEILSLEKLFQEEILTEKQYQEKVLPLNEALASFQKS